MPKFKTAKQLGILPEEFKALKAFVEAPALGRTVSVNGHAHYYNQAIISEGDTTGVAETNECGTAGCVAGFVFAHAKHVQGKRSLRGAKTANDYFHKAAEGDYNDDTGECETPCPLLDELYSEGNSAMKLADARKVVTKALRTGKVDWPLR